MGSSMENYPIKSVAFGGFDKQDVVTYIERMVTESAAAQKALQDELNALREELSASEAACASLRQELHEAREQLAAAEGRLHEETAVREALEPLKQEVKMLRGKAEVLGAENEKLLPDAQAYAQFRERLGAIECEARKRAADLEEEANARMQKTVDQFRKQYQVLMSTFETTAAHVNNELRKVEVNLTQLPRALDQNGLELNELAALLERKKEN